MEATTGNSEEDELDRSDHGDRQKRHESTTRRLASPQRQQQQEAQIEHQSPPQAQEQHTPNDEKPDGFWGSRYSDFHRNDSRGGGDLQHLPEEDDDDDDDENDASMDESEWREMQISALQLLGTSTSSQDPMVEQAAEPFRHVTWADESQAIDLDAFHQDYSTARNNYLMYRQQYENCNHHANQSGGTAHANSKRHRLLMQQYPYLYESNNTSNHDLAILLASNEEQSRHHRHQHPHQGRCRGRIHYGWAFCIIISQIIAVTVLVLIFFPQLNGGFGSFFQSTAPPPPPALPTLAPTTQDQAADSDTVVIVPTDLLELLPNATRRVMQQDPNHTSAAYRAYDWTIHDPMFDNYTNARKLQRFALATLFYATTKNHKLVNLGSRQEGEFNETMPANQTTYSSMADNINMALTSKTHVIPNNSKGAALSSVAAFNSNTPGITRAENNETNATHAWDADYLWLSYDLHECAWFSTSHRYDKDAIAAIEASNVTSSQPQTEHGEPDFAVINGAYDNHTTPNDQRNTTLDWTIDALCNDQEEYEILSLVHLGLKGVIPSELQLLTSLMELDLSSNGQLEGTLPPVIFKACTKLQHVLLYENQISGSLPTEIGMLSNLVSFVVSENYLTGPAFPLDGLNSSVLLRWEVASNALNGTIPSAIGEMWTGLKTLWIHENSIGGSLPTTIGNMTQLISLQAWGNGLTGNLPSEVGKLTQLRSLDVEGNSMTGSIPSELGNIIVGGSLEELWLSRNAFTGTIPPQLGPLGPPPAARLTKIHLEHNILSGTIPTECGRWVLLQEFMAHNNILSGPLPSELGRLKALVDLHLHANIFNETLPSQLGRLSSLQRLYLMDNQYVGQLPTEFGSLRSLQRLILQNNQCSATIPTTLGLLSNVEWLYLNQNLFSGPIPSEVGLLSHLQILDLSQNSLSSTLPSELGHLMFTMSDNGGRLEELRLFRNALSGSLPEDFFPNSFNDNGSSIMRPVSRLKQLDLEHNNLRGTLSTGIGGLTALQDIWLNSNHFSGKLPSEICLLRPLSPSGPSDLNIVAGDNLLVGAIPSEIALLSDHLVLLNLELNQLVGLLPSQIGQLTKLKELVLNSNNFEGNIPTEIGLLSTHLQTLEFANNHLTWLPSEIGLCSQLEQLHLAQNPFLFGPIPSDEMASWSNLHELTLANTGLSGTVPEELCYVDLLTFDCVHGGVEGLNGICGCHCSC